MMKSIVVIGAGGMAREVAWTIAELNRVSERYDFLGYIVTDLAQLGPYDSREQVLGDYSWFERNPGRAACAAIGIGTPAVRLRVAAELSRRLPEMEWPALVHPTAIFDAASCRFARGSFVGAGVVATCNVVLEEFALANFACTVGHEARLGRGSVVNPGANISGGVEIGEGVLIGTGARVLQYCKVGAGATVGAGAVVTRDVAPGVTVTGIPARPQEQASAQHL